LVGEGERQRLIADSARAKLDDAEGCPSFIGGHPDFEVRAGGGVAETGCPFISRRIAAQKTLVINNQLRSA